MKHTAAGPMGGGSSKPSDDSHRESGYCKTCGGKIFKVNDGSPDKYAWQHDIEQGSGVPHQAQPGGASKESGLERRIFAEHPSGYRAEYHGGGRYHVFEGDTAVESPGFSWYTQAETSSELAEKTKRVTPSYLRRTLESWVRRNGDSYSRFNHPDMPEMNYADRQRMKGLDMQSSRRLAYGETKAPAEVDTLRESDCPVCGNTESWDGDRCMICGFFRPPEMFTDPDTSIHQQVDLRQQQQGAPAVTDLGPGEQTGAAPSQTGGGSLALPPVDPSDVSEDGMVGHDVGDQPQMIPGMVTNDQVDPNGIAAADAQSQTDDLLNPEGLGPDGLPVDPDAAPRHFNQGGEPFTPGPNAPFPQQFAEPMDPASQEELDENGGDGQPMAFPSGEPGTPQDGTPDLFCPSCGYESEAQQPLSQGDSPMDPAGAGDGLLEGDVCPQCGKAPMSSISNAMAG